MSDQILIAIKNHSLPLLRLILLMRILPGLYENLMKQICKVYVTGLFCDDWYKALNARKLSDLAA
jgi:hypothetical protein